MFNEGDRVTIRSDLHHGMRADIETPGWSAEDTVTEENMRLARYTGDLNLVVLRVIHDYDGGQFLTLGDRDGLGRTYIIEAWLTEEMRAAVGAELAVCVGDGIAALY